jgi:hypothetical protein
VPEASGFRPQNVGIYRLAFASVFFIVAEFIKLYSFAAFEARTAKTAKLSLL